MKDVRPMTTCKCGKSPDDLVMSRNYLQELNRYVANLERLNTFDAIIEHLVAKKETYFHQSLVGGEKFWTVKAKAIENLINELEEMKCR